MLLVQTITYFLEEALLLRNIAAHNHQSCLVFALVTMSPDTIHCLYSFKFLEMLKVTHHLAATIAVVVVTCGTLYFVTVLLLVVVIIILILVHKRRARPTEKERKYPFSDYVLPPHMPQQYMYHYLETVYN